MGDITVSSTWKPREEVVDQVVATITHALEEIGYSQVALYHIYDILVGGLLQEPEERFHEILEAMQDIHNTEEEDETDGTYTDIYNN